ncbi:hypothetical protein CIG75_13780 [Tumebacillus algifaecis]|uniref:Uncharacterized protein n=1 Tax=Tumebacillus algifaecis TaxID=1214604 RepID=A0A223D3B8_9BACL|nr:hypothetical protein [Tumebacillus algifaecis]ASS75923.1 hypothetical protein CIG75_13780 [Tumebacillus algifaecis]
MYLLVLIILCALLIFTIFLWIAPIVTNIYNFFQTTTHTMIINGIIVFWVELKREIKIQLLDMRQEVPAWIKRKTIGIAAITYLAFCFYMNELNFIELIIAVISFFYLIITVPISLLKGRNGSEYGSNLLSVLLFLFAVLILPAFVIISNKLNNGIQLFFSIMLIISPIAPLTTDILKRTRNTTFSLFVGVLFLIITYGTIFYAYGVYNIRHSENVTISELPYYTKNDIWEIAYSGISSAFQFPSTFTGSILPTAEFVFFWFYSFVVGTTIFAYISAAVSESRSGRYTN